jgi:hypothetical protein
MAIGSISEDIHQIADDDLLDEPDEHDQNEKRHIEATDVRNVTPDRLQQRFSDPVKHIANDGHQGMTGVNHAERDQPTQDRRYEQNEKVEIQKFVDEQQQPEHVSNPYCGAGYLYRSHVLTARPSASPGWAGDISWRFNAEMVKNA